MAAFYIFSVAHGCTIIINIVLVYPWNRAASLSISPMQFNGSLVWLNLPTLFFLLFFAPLSVSKGAHQQSSANPSIFHPTVKEEKQRRAIVVTEGVCGCVRIRENNEGGEGTSLWPSPTPLDICIRACITHYIYLTTWPHSLEYALTAEVFSMPVREDSPRNELH